MKKRNIILLMLLLGVILANGLHASKNPYEKIAFEEVLSKLITRDASDRIYSGQIKSKEGLENFLKDYDVDLNKDDIDFSKKMLIFGITDNISTRAFQFLKGKGLKLYVLDYYDTGIRYKLGVLGKGRKYSYIQILEVSRIENLPHIWIKNLVTDKLSKVYE